MKKKDNIFALSTASGRSATSLIRVSGPDSIKIISSISTNIPKKTNQATLNKIISKSGETIDQTITTIFKEPKSYTGENMVEISAHGGNAVIKKIFEELRGVKNTRLANTGEFTRRAFENNKLDLTQVEAIADIVNAETEMQRKQAMSHLSGNFFAKSKKIFTQLKKTLANIEAVIDFSDEDLPQNTLNKTKEQIENNILTITKMISGADFGISLRSGFLVVLLGKPNTGKSSFINYISGKNISIVTNTPGTTRDLLESFLDIQGVPIKFVDTAGIRKTTKSTDKIEKIGIKLAIKASKESDVNLVFINKKEDILSFKDFKNTVFVKSKQDISGANLNNADFYNISSKTGFGVEEVLSKIIAKITPKAANELGYISRERHVFCMNNVKKHLIKAKEEKNIDLVAEDIRLAINDLSSLFGSVDIENILDIIFADFCIGK